MDSEHVQGVGLEDEDEDSEDEDLVRAGEVGSSSIFDLRTQMAPSPPVTQAKSSSSSNLAPQLVFMHDVDKAVL